MIPVNYPKGDIVGPCICGSWPGGECFQCTHTEDVLSNQLVKLLNECKQEVTSPYLKNKIDFILAN